MKRKIKENLKGRNFALTILLGVFISIMVITLFNLIVDYSYEAPKYEDYCKGVDFYGSYPIKYGTSNDICGNCSFSKELQEQVDQCMQDGGMTIYEYDNQGCTVALKQCNFCQKDYDEAIKVHNRQTFFIFAVIGFILIVLGLFIETLLLQIITLPAGAFLVIEAAVKNFDDKLFVIVVFGLLIIAAIYLALKRLK
jgi:hypothetical protein